MYSILEQNEANCNNLVMQVIIASSAQDHCEFPYVTDTGEGGRTKEEHVTWVGVGPVLLGICGEGAPPCPWATGTSCHGSTSRPRDLGFTLPASRQPERCGLWAPAPPDCTDFRIQFEVTLRGRHKCTATSRAPAAGRKQVLSAAGGSLSCSAVHGLKAGRSLQS